MSFVTPWSRSCTARSSPRRCAPNQSPTQHKHQTHSRAQRDRRALAMGNLCCGGEGDEVAPLLDERQRVAAKRRGSTSPVSSLPSSRRTTPSRPPPLLDDSLSASPPPNDSSRGPDDGVNHHKRHHQQDDHGGDGDGDGDAVDRHHDTKKKRKHKKEKGEEAATLLASLSVPSTLASSASVLQHPTKSRPRGPLKRNPSRQHHLRVPDVGRDTLFLHAAAAATPSRHDDNDGHDHHQNNGGDDDGHDQGTGEGEGGKRKESGAMVRMMPAGFDPADVRKQLKSAAAAGGGGGGRGRGRGVGVGLGGFDASAARANLRRVARDTNNP